MEFGPSAVRMPNHPNVLNFIAGFEAAAEPRDQRLKSLQAVITLALFHLESYVPLAVLSEHPVTYAEVAGQQDNEGEQSDGYVSCGGCDEGFRDWGAYIAHLAPPSGSYA